jgi:hypothetical protein
VTSCDPIYMFTAEEIRARILATRERMIVNVRAAREEFVWQEFVSPEHLGEVRVAAMEQLSLDFHVAAIEEMCRVASEARVFPLLKGYGGPSPYLEPVLYGLRDRGYTATIKEAPYEFQRGGN